MSTPRRRTVGMWTHQDNDESCPYHSTDSDEEEEHIKDNDLPVAARLCEHMNRANEELKVQAPKMQNQARVQILGALTRVEKTGVKMGDAVGKAFGGLDCPCDKAELRDFISETDPQEKELRKELRPVLSKGIRVVEEYKEASLPLIQSLEAKAKDCLRPLDEALSVIAHASPRTVPDGSSTTDADSDNGGCIIEDGSDSHTLQAQGQTDATREITSSSSSVAVNVRRGYEGLALLFEAALRAAEAPIARVERSVLQHVAIPLDRSLNSLATWGDKQVGIDMQKRHQSTHSANTTSFSKKGGPNYAV